MKTAPDARQEDAQDTLVERLRQRVVPYLPKAFQADSLPWVFLLALLIMALMVFFSFVNQGVYGNHIPLIFAAVVGALLLAMIQGLPLSPAVQIAMGVGLLQLAVAAWDSGGIYSPRLTWLLLLPLTPFFFFGPRVGLRWLLVVLVAQGVILVMTDQDWLGREVILGLPHINASLATYVIVTLLMMVIPLIYHRLNVRALQQERAYQAELEAKREELEQIQIMRDQFIASVSHELRTPMNAILGFNDLLLSRIHDRPEALKVLNHTRHSADHLMTVINDVLDYSQLQSGTLLLHPETFDLRESVRKAFEVLAPKAATQQLDYRCDLDPAMPQWVHTDRHRLVQVLVNLLGNALKFTARGQVVLSTRWLDPGVEFSVQDTGIGISANKQDTIFQRFAQADSTIAQRYGGYGLGLAISRRLVQLLGGDMGFDSREGVGSRFWFRLPLSHVTAPLASSEPVHQGIETTQTPWRFLVVDDHPVNRVLVNRMLKASWPQALIREVADGVEALQALRDEPADAVFMDMLMPRMDGITCTERIRQTLPEDRRRVVIFGLTANVNPEDLKRFQAAGLDGLMLKPFDWRQLCAETERLLLERQT
jgi:signal transduction histidine kinase/CheY-like chemotaxis protein